jgi:hypothetical protein
MTVTEIRKMRLNYPNQFWSEWVKRDPKSLALARIRVSYEDTRTILKRVKMGKANESDGEFAKVNHLNLLKRMIEKNWVNKIEVKPYLIH